MSTEAKTLSELSEMQDPEINYSDIPELDEEWFENAKVVYPKKKKPISLRVDPEVLEWFKSRGSRYQSHINAVLEAYVKAQKARTRTGNVRQ